MKQKVYLWLSALSLVILVSIFGTASLYATHSGTVVSNVGGGKFDWSNGTCKGKGGPVKLTASPMNLRDIGFIIPMGSMVSAHVTPVDHQYYSPVNFNAPRDTYDVFAPAKGYIVSVQHRTQFVGEQQKPVDEYRVIMEHSCTFWSYFDLMTSLSPQIRSQIAAFKGKSLRIPIKAGELLGKVGHQTLDFGVVNADVTLPGLLDPQQYQAEPWKVHTVDPFDYFAEPVKSELLAKDLRSALPRGGKIDYDIAGRLVGNWFREHTNGYAGVDKNRYWDSHLAIAYDNIDPSQIIVSMGNFNGIAQQFAVKGNSPDPASVSQQTGLVIYELVPYNYTLGDSGQPWNGTSYASNIHVTRRDDQVVGVILLQVLSAANIKVEIFPGLTRAQVNGFDSHAQIYER